MPQRKQLTWTELRVGLFVLVGLSVLAAGIFYVTGQGILGPKYRLKTYLPEVSGLAKGATVRVDGVEVGNVESINFLPRTPGKATERNKNIEVVMRVDRKFQGDIFLMPASLPGRKKRPCRKSWREARKFSAIFPPCLPTCVS